MRTLVYGYFYSDPFQTESATPGEHFTKFAAGYQGAGKYNPAADNHWAVCGSGSDQWYKVTPSPNMLVTPERAECYTLDEKQRCICNGKVFN